MNSKIAREALDKKLSELLPLNQMQRPHKGWIRAIKEALGMSSKQLAKRLGVSGARITALEKAEIAESLTIASLRRAAEELDCALVYSFVPKKSLEEIVRVRARIVAKQLIGEADQTMSLESQGLNQDALNKEVEKLTQNIIDNRPKIIWEEINE